LPRLPARKAEMHKGEAGRVAIVGGSLAMTGAPSLSARGALRGGAGLVRVFTPASAHPIVAAQEICVMTTPVEDAGTGELSMDSADALLSALEWADVVVIGPGLGTSDAVRDVVARLLTINKPLVLDADGLNAAAHIEQWWKRRSAATIVTPHAGEMARLRRGVGMVESHGSDDQARRANAVEYARHTGAIVALKGRRTVVCEAKTSFVNPTGNAGMAAAGMGDVLTGLIAALWGQGMSPFDAACLAVYAHGEAGDTLVDAIGPFGYLARDVADALPGVLARHIDPSPGPRGQQ
jgi:NAD(P)H-hydrate epimerase